MGGKPSKGTRRDHRLKENKRASTKAAPSSPKTGKKVTD